MVKNSTKKTIVSKKHKVCRSIFCKTLGLMFSLKPKTLIFIFKNETFVPLHMCFVFFPIDVIYLDKNKKVIEMKQNFKPWTFYNPRKKSKYIIELPRGAIKKSNTAIGDTILF